MNHQTTMPARSHLSHVPLTSPRTYYRSKVFSANSGINPLVTAAANLLTTTAHLRELPEHSNVQELYQELVHEIKAFETQAQTHGYRSDLILVSRYVLCATLDETILATAWGQISDWQRHKLLTTFHNEDWGGERFFLIMQRLSADIALHIDILELIYLCLNLGFVGKYQVIPNGQQELSQVIENLYETIRWQRGDLIKDLHLQEEKMIPSKPLSTREPLPLWLLILFIVTVLVTLYTVFNFMLGSHTNTLFQQLTSFLQNYG